MAAYFPKLISHCHGRTGVARILRLTWFYFSWLNFSDPAVQAFLDSVRALNMEKSAAAPIPAPADSKAPKPKLVIEEKIKEKQRSKLAQEEAAIESAIVDHILDGQWQSLHPNSGVSVEIKGSHLCVDYHEEVGYRVWEWHGHCMIYEDGEGYTPEYIYGNYFEPLVQEDDVSRPVGLGLISSNRRVMPEMRDILSPVGRQGTIPMRSMLDEAFRRASK